MATMVIINVYDGNVNKLPQFALLKRQKEEKSGRNRMKLEKKRT